jgi:hypothetical protein
MGYTVTLFLCNERSEAGSVRMTTLLCGIVTWKHTYEKWIWTESPITNKYKPDDCNCLLEDVTNTLQTKIVMRLYKMASEFKANQNIIKMTPYQN